MQAKATPKRVRVDGVPNLYQRPKDGRYEVGYTGSDGKWRIETLKAARTLTDAKREMRAVLGKRDQRKDVARTDATLADVAEDLFATLETLVTSGERSSRTLQLYRQRWRSHIKPSLGARRIQTITATDVAALLAELRKGSLSNWSRHGVLTLLGAIYRHAITRGVVSESPLSRLDRSERPKQKNKTKIRTLTPDETQRLIAGAWPTWRPFVTTAVYSGARASEILGLRWADVDTRTGTIHIHQQLGRDGSLVPLKTAGSVRTIQMAPQLAAALREHRVASRHKDGFVFCTDTSKPVGYHNANRAFVAAVKRAKLDGGEERLSLHSLRHTCASALIGNGADPVKVSRFLGHSKVSTTLDLYADLWAAQDGSNMGDLLGAAFR